MKCIDCLHQMIIVCSAIFYKTKKFICPPNCHKVPKLKRCVCFCEVLSHCTKTLTLLYVNVLTTGITSFLVQYGGDLMKIYTHHSPALPHSFIVTSHMAKKVCK